MASAYPLSGAPLAAVVPVHSHTPLRPNGGLRPSVSSNDGGDDPNNRITAFPKSTVTPTASSPGIYNFQQNSGLQTQPTPFSPQFAKFSESESSKSTSTSHLISPASTQSLSPQQSPSTSTSQSWQPQISAPISNGSAVALPGGTPSLNLSTFRSFFDAEGRCANEYDLHKAIYWQGIAKEARAEIWPCMLGVFAADLTLEQREEHRQKLRSDYQELLALASRCETSRLPGDSETRTRIKEIEKDVPRTDRGMAFYSEEDGASLAMLRRILTGYAVYNRALGYVQGMNDVASVVLLVLKDDETTAFWCFVKVMERMGGRFTDLAESARQDLRSLMGHVDPELHRHLDWLSGKEWKFCLRWTLLCFKRELPINDVIELWERVWSRHKLVDLTNYLIAAVLIQSRFSLLSSRTDEDLHQFAHWISNQLHIKTLLAGGQDLAEKFKQPSRHSSSTEDSSAQPVVAPPQQGFVPRMAAEQPPHLAAGHGLHIIDPSAQWQSPTSSLSQPSRLPESIQSEISTSSVHFNGDLNSSMAASSPTGPNPIMAANSTQTMAAGSDGSFPMQNSLTHSAKDPAAPTTASTTWAQGHAESTWATPGAGYTATLHNGHQQISPQTEVVPHWSPMSAAAPASFMPGHADSSMQMSQNPASSWNLVAIPEQVNGVADGGFTGLRKMASGPLSQLHQLISPGSSKPSYPGVVSDADLV